MSHRIVKGLRVACKSGPPAFANTRRPRGKGPKGQGLKYEKELGKALGPEWRPGAWFHFLDSDGAGYCQTDFLRELEDAVIVLEAKLSWVPEAHTQLELLYRPVVERVFGKPMIGLVVCKRLVPGCTGAIAQTLPSALTAARNCRNVVLHWTGKAPIVQVTRRPAPASGPLSPRPAVA